MKALTIQKIITMQIGTINKTSMHTSEEDGRPDVSPELEPNKSEGRPRKVDHLGSLWMGSSLANWEKRQGRTESLDSIGSRLSPWGRTWGAGVRVGGECCALEEQSEEAMVEG